MKKANTDKLTPRQRADLASIAALPDESIDLTEMPEARSLSGAKRGLFYRPVKQQLTLRIDADVVAWFKENTRDGHGYQTEINRALRNFMQSQRKKAG